MITDLETYKEVYDNIVADHEKLRYRIDYYKPKAIKELRNTKTFPAWKWYEYECPKSRNKYIIYYYADNKKSIDNPRPGCFLTINIGKGEFIIKWLISGYKHSNETPTKAVRLIHVYSKHFLLRYAERCLKNCTLGVIDSACRFLTRNYLFMPLEITEGINRNVAKYGEGGKRGFRVQDGMCFAQSWLEGQFYNDGDKSKDKVDAIVYVFTTFVTESDMTIEQRLSIDKEHWKKWIRAYMDFTDEATNGELTLRLDQ